MAAIDSLMREMGADKPLGIGLFQGFIEAMVEIADRDSVRVLHASNESRYTQERLWFARSCSVLSEVRLT